MTATVPPSPPAPWVQLARMMPEMAMEAFAEKFGKDIHVDMKVQTDAAGNRAPVFSFTHATPGLLPTAIEREWFAGYVLGFRQCCNQVLDMFDAAANMQVPS
jgi:hypothetical protein